jgi:hypothetical protein
MGPIAGWLKVVHDHIQLCSAHTQQLSLPRSQAEDPTTRSVSHLSPASVTVSREVDGVTRVHLEGVPVLCGVQAVEPQRVPVVGCPSSRVEREVRAAKATRAYRERMSKQHTEPSVVRCPMPV